MNEIQSLAVYLSECAEEINAWAIIVGKMIAQGVEAETGMDLSQLNERELVYAPLYYAPLIAPAAIIFVLPETDNVVYLH